MASDPGTTSTPAIRPVTASTVPIPAKAPSSGGKELPIGGNPPPPTTTGSSAPTAHATQAHGLLPPQAHGPAPSAVTPTAATHAPPPPPKVKASAANDLQAMVAQLNKHLNDSGRPNQYRVDTSSGGALIQEINPANGEVVGEISVAEFPALAQSLGASGILVNQHA